MKTTENLLEAQETLDELLRLIGEARMENVRRVLRRGLYEAAREYVQTHCIVYEHERDEQQQDYENSQ